MTAPNRRWSATPFLWIAAFGLLTLWVLWYLDGFALWSTVDSAEGPRRILDTFTAVDHPFHATRAATLLDSLRDGQQLRWIGHHQGGYPADFYPLGVAWLEVLVSALSFGVLPVIAAHKLVVLLLFVAPGIAYVLLARGDRLSLSVAFLALCLHLAIPGDWTHGGYTELVGWGLVTNAGGAVVVLIATAALARYAYRGELWAFALASGAGAVAAYVNPRSLLGLAIAALAILIGGLLPVAVDGVELRPVRVLGRLAIAALASLLLAAPELVPLFRYRDLYQFLHYQSYDTLRVYWDASVLAVSPPVLWAAALGGVWAFLSPRTPVARSVAVCLVGYVVLTIVLTDTDARSGPIQQLETPRLMPFQRLLIIYLAAFGAYRVLETAGAWLRQRWVAPSLAAAIGMLAIVATTLPFDRVPLPYQAFAEVEQTGVREFAAFRDAVTMADGVAPPGTAILVVGSRLSWHEQLWAPLDTDHPLYYDDWLWYWHDRHDGPYIYQQGHSYPEPADALTSDYFQTHAIGAVVVTDRPSTPVNEHDAAAIQDSLTRVADGDWGVYTVDDPTTLASLADSRAQEIDVSPHRIEATFPDSNGGGVVVRQNWFPRWQATINGQEVPIERRDDGYMQVQAPAGTIDLQLTYGVTGVDWLTRLAVAAGIVVIAVVAWSQRRPSKGDLAEARIPESE